MIQLCIYKVPPSVVCACSPRMGLTVNEPIDPAETGTENEFKSSQHGRVNMYLERKQCLHHVDDP